ncbi:unnamed protein product [Phytophthora fragariaefolia]|uniref:Unnamed protein product n=1 Tax=Phytophthora fragariaefolia TaxID=1490495 RepID=A0A9W6YEQ4_9STRA|nr:unnamed protein product [Phytophthora fragariaefolia]
MPSPLQTVEVILAFLFAVIIVPASASLTDSSHIDGVQQEQQLRLQNSTMEWPSLRFNFSLKRRSMKVHGQSDFSLLADPIVSMDGSHVTYNVFATFQEDMAIHNYTVFGGASYYTSSSIDPAITRTTVTCMEPELSHVPAINTIVAGLNGATAIASASNGEISVKCSHNLFKVIVNDAKFAVCASGLSGFEMHGSDMDIVVEYLSTHATISPPPLKDEKLPKCTEVNSNFVVTSTGKALLTGQLISSKDSRRLKADFDFDFSWGDSSSCSCKSTPRPCIFIHGMGVRTELPYNLDSFKYWGNLTGHAPCCSSMKFAKLNTVNNTWTNDTQQHQVCDRALAVSKTSTKSTIADTIVVTHSMGNLMLAGAIATGKCRLALSSTWVGIAGPMKGSMAADFIQDSCAGDTNFILEKMVEGSGRCPPHTSLKSMSYQGQKHSNARLDAAYRAAQKAYQANVYALMCSDSFSGLASSDQVKLWTLGLVGQHHSLRNDGMVEFQSCAVGIPASMFGKTWRDRFYRSKVNHYDMQFKYGDALFNKAKMPVKWFECLL